MVLLEQGGFYDLDDVLRDLVKIQYTRNDFQLNRGNFRVRGDVLEVHPAYQDTIYRISFFGDEVENMTEADPLTGDPARARHRDRLPRDPLRDRRGPPRGRRKEHRG